MLWARMCVRLNHGLSCVIRLSSMFASSFDEIELNATCRVAELESKQEAGGGGQLQKSERLMALVQLFPSSPSSPNR
jgi:hypothetical protein